jgi:tetratricopeptide (TPR) repeat protein
VPWASARLGAAYLLAGRVDDSLALLKRTVEIDAAHTSQAEISLWCGWLAEAYLASGQPAEADALAGRALDLAVRHGERGNHGWALRLQAELAVRRAPPDHDAAEELYQQALALAEELEMRPLQAHCHLGLALLSQR